VVFAAMLVAVASVLTRSGLSFVSDKTKQALVVAYVAGPMAAFWLIERVAGF
jgi:hypothetical protein